MDDSVEDLLSNWVFVSDEPPFEKCHGSNGSDKVASKSPKFTKSPKLTNPEIVKSVYLLGRIISRAFQELDIPYWTSSGTTLGLVRHRGLIPWDDDLDLCIKDENDLKLRQSTEILARNYGLILTEAPSFGYRIHHKIESEILKGHENELGGHYPFCDLFVMIRDGQEWIQKFRIARVLWPNEIYYDSEVQQCDSRPFGDYTLRCPSNPERYLAQNYGPDWNRVGKTQDYDHLEKKFVEQDAFNLQDGHFEPARPFH